MLSLPKPNFSKGELEWLTSALLKNRNFSEEPYENGVRKIFHWKRFGK